MREEKISLESSDSERYTQEKKKYNSNQRKENEM